MPLRPVVIDLETYDPYLKERGTDAHCRRWGGYVFMVGLFYPDTGEKVILPWNEQSKAQVKHRLDSGGYEWWGANIKYDLGWLLSEGVLEPHHTFINRFRDILIDAPLIDETHPPYFYSMDSQCQHYGLPTKPIEKLLENAAKLGIKTDAKKVRGELHRLDYDVVAEYLDHDLVSTWAVAEKQAPLLQEYKLLEVSEVESLLLPVLALMEHQGVRVDVEAAESLYADCYKYIDSVAERLKLENGGKTVPLSACNDLTNFLINRGHKLPESPSSTAEKPRYSTAAVVLEQLSAVDPLVKEMLNARRAEKIAKDFCKGAVINYSHNGRVHANINQMISFKAGAGDDDGQGVRFGRLSMTNPNLQQVPKRDKVEVDGIGGLGSAMRRLFIAEDGYEFMSADFSSQEPRWIIHWCEKWKMPGADKVGDMYRLDKTISSHDIVAGGIEADIPYKQKRALAKIINLGKGYEMGLKKLIANLVAEGVDPSQAQRIMDDYDRNFPHVSAGSRAAMGAAEKLGYVRTYLGRRLHFNQWEPVVKGAGPMLDYDTAYQKYVIGKRMPIKRAFCYRAFNRVVQGSSADQTKLAMVKLWYDHKILPTLQVHDELTDARSTPERAAIFKDVMENVVQLTIPCLTEIKIGPNWKDGVLFDVA